MQDIFNGYCICRDIFCPGGHFVLYFTVMSRKPGGQRHSEVTAVVEFLVQWPAQNGNSQASY